MTKEEKAAEIAACIAIVAKHYNLDPFKITSPKAWRGNAVRDARQILWYHLHRCGMSYEAIAKIWQRTPLTIHEGARFGYLRLMGEDRDMVENLPRITFNPYLQHYES